MAKEKIVLEEVTDIATYEQEPARDTNLVPTGIASYESALIADDDYIGQLYSQQAMACSWVPESDEDREHLFNLTSNPDNRISSFVNKVIVVTDFYLEVVTMDDKQNPIINRETGEVVGYPKTKGPRLVLMNRNTKESWVCISTGVLNAIKKLRQPFMLGEFPWVNPPAKLEVLQIEREGAKRLFTLKLAQFNKK